MRRSRHREPPADALRAWGRDRRASRRSLRPVGSQCPVAKQGGAHAYRRRSTVYPDRSTTGRGGPGHRQRPYGPGAARRRQRSGPTAHPANRGKPDIAGDRGVDGGAGGHPAGGGDGAHGPAWLPVAVFFTSRGHRVFRVASAKAADLRRFLSRHAKSNGIDADTLARLPLLAPGSLQPLELPGCEAAALDRRVRACDRLSRQGALHQRRIKDLVRQLMPVTPLTGELTKTDLAVLAHWAVPASVAGRRSVLDSSP